MKTDKVSAEELAAFDDLPELLRNAVRDAPVHISARKILARYERLMYEGLNSATAERETIRALDEFLRTCRAQEQRLYSGGGRRP